MFMEGIIYDLMSVSGKTDLVRFRVDILFCDSDLILLTEMWSDGHCFLSHNDKYRWLCNIFSRRQKAFYWRHVECYCEVYFKYPKQQYNDERINKAYPRNITRVNYSLYRPSQPSTDVHTSRRYLRWINGMGIYLCWFRVPISSFSSYWYLLCDN